MVSHLLDAGAKYDDRIAPAVASLQPFMAYTEASQALCTLLAESVSCLLHLSTR